MSLLGVARVAVSDIGLPGFTGCPFGGDFELFHPIDVLPGEQLDIALVAKAGSDTVGKTFRIELQRATHSAPWRVVSWLPNGISGAGNVKSIAKKESMVAAAETSGPRLGTWWLAFPGALLSLALLLPVLITVRSWRAGRRAEREYLAERGVSVRGN
jgi:hypothetical protein